MSKRKMSLIALGAIALAAIGVLAGQGSETSDGGQLPTTTAATDTKAPLPEGDTPEKNDGPIATPDAGKRAGPPVATARAFVAEWVNRIASATELRRQRPILVGLATGEFATLVQLTIDDALATGDFGPENEGSVVVVKAVEGGGEGPTVLVVTRERQVRSGRGLEPYRFVTYIARLAPVPGGFAVSALEPQQ